MVSFVWDHFIKKSKSEAICKICKTIIKTCANTTNMKNHLIIHGINGNKRKNNENCVDITVSPKKNKVESIKNYVKR